MSTREPAAVPLEAPCCPPPGESPTGADLAAGPAGTVMAPGDPVRARLVSVVASFPGGEACVGDLLPADGPPAGAVRS